jgi:hypothetical protein
MRDIVLEETIYMDFTTRAFATGIPTVLAGTPVLSVLEENNATPITAGVSVAVDRASVVGLNMATIVATAANGYEAGKGYSVYISTGTVGGVSVIGEVVAQFTIDASSAAQDLANGTDGLGAIKADTAATLTDTAELQTILSSGIAGRTNNANLNDYLMHITNIIESQREHHTHVTPGETFYVDPVNGATHASGARGGISDSYLTIQDCHDNAVTDSNHDLIMLIPGAAAGATTHTVAATTTISKRFTLIRGPGRDFIITRTGSGNTLALTGEGVEVEGVQMGTAATGSGNGIDITADFAWIHNVWINDTQGDGININQSENCIIEDNRLQDTGVSGSGQGVHVQGTGSSSSNNVIRRNIFEDVQGDAIRLVGGTILDTIIDDNIIHGSSGWGINIGGASTDAVISNNTLGNNSSGDILDDGTTTVDVNNDQWAKHSIATELRLAELDPANIPADLDATLADTNELQGDWVDGGRLDLILDARMAEASINTTAGAVDNVTTVATTTTNTDMRGTDGANTTVPDAAGTAPTAVENRQEMDSNSTQLSSIKTDTGTNLPALIDDLAVKKNATFSNFEFLMVLTSDHVTPATGLTVTGQRSINGAAFAGVTGVIAEVSNGIYQFDAVAADTNGDVITWRFSSATADDTFVTFKTVA